MYVFNILGGKKNHNALPGLVEAILFEELCVLEEIH